MFPARFHVEDRTNFKFLPAFASGVDHATIKTDALASLFTVALLREYRALYWISHGCLLSDLLHALTVLLGLSPDADTRNVAMPAPFEHF